jgi:hypothetical protein
LALVLSALIAGAATAFAETGERLMMQSARVKAFLPPNATCAAQMKFILRGAVDDVFAEQTQEVAEMVAGLRAVATLQCNQLQKIILVGYVGDELLFAGSASENEDWQLRTLIAKPSGK